MMKWYYFGIYNGILLVWEGSCLCSSFNVTRKLQEEGNYTMTFFLLNSVFNVQKLYSFYSDERVCHLQVWEAIFSFHYTRDLLTL